VEVAVTRLAAICFLVIGISHIFQPQAWVRFFLDMRARGKTGSLLNALLHFPLGLAIVSFHNVWSGLPLIFTLIGWGLVLKSFIHFVFPTYGLRALDRISLERSWEFVVAGLFAIVISLFLFYLLWRS
jgi:hypothetical protein